MLDSKQLADIDSAERELKDKQLILDTAVDIQALLRFLVDKNVITKEEINKYRAEVRNSPKWKAAQTFIDQTLQEIEACRNNPQAHLKRMWAEKLRGN